MNASNAEPRSGARRRQELPAVLGVIASPRPAWLLGSDGSVLALNLLARLVWRFRRVRDTTLENASGWILALERQPPTYRGGLQYKLHIHLSRFLTVHFLAHTSIYGVDVGDRRFILVVYSPESRSVVTRSIVLMLYNITRIFSSMFDVGYKSSSMLRGGVENTLFERTELTIADVAELRREAVRMERPLGGEAAKDEYSDADAVLDAAIDRVRQLPELDELRKQLVAPNDRWRRPLDPGQALVHQEVVRLVRDFQAVPQSESGSGIGSERQP